VFAKRLVELRREKGLSQGELADGLNMSRSTLANYEIGQRQPDFEMLIRLAEFFSVTTDYLLGVSENRLLQQTSPTPEQDEELNFVIAANKDGDYGKEPSPELRAIIKRIVNAELDKRK